MTPAMVDLILASASQSRRSLLEAAGIKFRTVAAGVDESAIKCQHATTGAGFDDLAGQLASLKALTVANRYPGALVIGADQVLVMEDEALDKPDSLGSARQQLLKLRGRTHSLETAVVCAVGQDVVWSHVESAHMEMREFSAEYLESYLATQKGSVSETVGGYKIEGHGIQLFKRISGDYFAILGLPLLPLLEFLRKYGAVAI